MPRIKKVKRTQPSGGIASDAARQPLQPQHDPASHNQAPIEDAMVVDTNDGKDQTSSPKSDKTNSTAYKDALEYQGNDANDLYTESSSKQMPAKRVRFLPLVPPGSASGAGPSTAGPPAFGPSTSGTSAPQSAQSQHVASYSTALQPPTSSLQALTIDDTQSIDDSGLPYQIIYRRLEQEPGFIPIPPMHEPEFLELPSDLRRIIYTFLFHDRGHARTPGLYTTMRLFTCRDRFAWHVLQVSKRINREAQPILYGNCIFHLTMQPPHSTASINYPQGATPSAIAAQPDVQFQEATMMEVATALTTTPLQWARDLTITIALTPTSYATLSDQTAPHIRAIRSLQEALNHIRDRRNAPKPIKQYDDEARVLAIIAPPIRPMNVFFTLTITPVVLGWMATLNPHPTGMGRELRGTAAAFGFTLKMLDPENDGARPWNLQVLGKTGPVWADWAMEGGRMTAEETEAVRRVVYLVAQNGPGVRCWMVEGGRSGDGGEEGDGEEHAESEEGIDEGDRDELLVDDGMVGDEIESGFAANLAEDDRVDDELIGGEGGDDQ